MCEQPFQEPRLQQVPPKRNRRTVSVRNAVLILSLFLVQSHAFTNPPPHFNIAKQAATATGTTEGTWTYIPKRFPLHDTMEHGEPERRTSNTSSSNNNKNKSTLTPSRKKRYKHRKKRKSKNGKAETTITTASRTQPPPTTQVVAATVVATTLTNAVVTAKKNGKKYSTNSAILSESSSSSSKTLTEGDLATHVAHSYIHGPGGFFSESDAKRQRLEEENGVYRTDPSHVQQLEYLRQLDRHPSLVLNADYQPLSILPLSLWSWQETVKAVFSGKVQVVEVYPNMNIRAVNMDVALPSVIALTDFVKQPNQVPAFTRRNVYLRDGYICQYCGNRFRTQDLTLDHVHPRCFGGKLEWDNAVTCCKKCNAKKGSTLPSELRGIGMKLLKEPRVPSKYELASVAGQMYPRRGVHPTWEPYLGLGMKPTKGGYGRTEDGDSFEDDELEFEF